jgi:ATP-dependent Clp protease adaptor protein ClpS
MKDALEESRDTVIAVEVTPETERKQKTDRREENRREPNYHVIIWNDEEHSYEYVIEMLMKLFKHPFEKAMDITTEVDRKGKGIAWTCHRELAELKCEQILTYGPDRTMAISKGSIRATIEQAPE